MAFVVATARGIRLRALEVKPVEMNMPEDAIRLVDGEAEPFIDEILRTLHRITADLSPSQVHTVYEVC